jgi:hypothetical protein
MFFKLLLFVVIGTVSGAVQFKSLSEYNSYKFNQKQREIADLRAISSHPDFDPIKAAGFKHLTNISKSSYSVSGPRDSNDVFS